MRAYTKTVILATARCSYGRYQIDYAQNRMPTPFSMPKTLATGCTGHCLDPCRRVGILFKPVPFWNCMYRVLHLLWAFRCVAFQLGCYSRLCHEIAKDCKRLTACKYYSSTNDIPLMVLQHWMCLCFAFVQLKKEQNIDSKIVVNFELEKCQVIFHQGGPSKLHLGDSAPLHCSECRLCLDPLVPV